MKIMGLWASNSTAMKRTGVLAANKTYTVYSSRARSFTSNTFGNTSEVQLICCFPVNIIFFFKFSVKSENKWCGFCYRNTDENISESFFVAVLGVGGTDIT